MRIGWTGLGRRISRIWNGALRGRSVKKDGLYISMDDGLVLDFLCVHLSDGEALFYSPHEYHTSLTAASKNFHSVALKTYQIFPRVSIQASNQLLLQHQ